VFGRRAAVAATSEPRVRPAGRPPEALAVPVPTEETRRALSAYAGLVRDEHGLQELMNDPHPLARMIGQSALARRESRGAHLRADFPDTDGHLDGRHLVRTGAVERWERWE